MTRILTIIGLLFAAPAWAEVPLDVREEMVIRCAISMTEIKIEKYGANGYVQDDIFEKCKKVTNELSCLDLMMPWCVIESSCQKEFARRCKAER